MDLLSLVGICLAALAILGGSAMEGGSLNALINFPAFCIVFGGSLSAVLIQTPMRTLKHASRLSRWMLHAHPMPEEALIQRFVTWAKIVRKEGLLALEKKTKQEHDAFRQKGLAALCSGCDPRYLKQKLMVEINKQIEDDQHAISVYEAMGSYAPTIGIVGAVIGLIDVMRKLSDPSEIGVGIAVAFVATVYGIVLANLCFLPIASKLRASMQARVREREMTLDALMYIAEGASPRFIEQQLRTYIST